MTTRPPHSIRRCLLPPAIACLLFLLLILPCKYAILYLTREGLRLATTLGIMDETNGLGGQILGFNYLRHPAWAHWVIGFLAATIALGIPFACCLVVAHRISGSRGRATFCGICGTDVDKHGGCTMTSGGLQCPSCHTAFGDPKHQTSTTTDGLPLVPRYVLIRLFAAVVSIGVAHVFLDRILTMHFQNAFLQMGEATGSEVMQLSGRIGIGPHGPFYGESVAARFWNTMYGYGPTYVNAILAGLASLATYELVSGPLGRTRFFGYRGPTRCGGCGYSLANLNSFCCPECGRNLAKETEL